MPLDVFLEDRCQQTSRSPVTTSVCSLQDDGYYWYLYPFFEDLEYETGKLIDLYGTATFSGAELIGLADMFAEARHYVAEQPDSWSVVVAVSMTRAAPQEIYATVEKERMQALIETLASAVGDAIAADRQVTFFGD